jgi:hypothetical protein
MYGKEGVKQVFRWPNGVLAFPRTNFCFEQRKVHRKWTTGLCNLLLFHATLKGTKRDWQNNPSGRFQQACLMLKVGGFCSVLHKKKFQLLEETPEQTPVDEVY